MSSFNNMGIEAGEGYDWARIRKLFVIGLIAAFMVLAGDMLLGYGTAQEGLTGLEGKLSAYLGLSDARIFWSAFLGLIGITLEALCYFGVYRLIAPNSPRHAHALRSGILGVLAFGACGVHVPCLACVFFYKYMMAASPETALDASIRFGAFFLLPAMVIFIVFFWVLFIALIGAFARGLTPYPRWCWVFAPPVAMAATQLLHLIGDYPLVNAISAGWISVGNIWMFAGLLAMMGVARANAEKIEAGD